MYEPLKQVNLGLKSFYQAGMSVTHVTAAVTSQYTFQFSGVGRKNPYSPFAVTNRSRIPASIGDIDRKFVIVAVASSCRCRISFSLRTV